MHAFPLTRARRENELNYILKMAEINGYNKKAILKLNGKHKRKRKWRNLCRLQPIRDERKRKVKDRNGRDVVRKLVIPYFSPMTRRIQTALRFHSMNVCYKNRSSHKEAIDRVKKGRRPQEKSGIYKIVSEFVCKNCWKIYYGQTKRRRRQRERTRPSSGKWNTRRLRCSSALFKNRPQKRK
jgi:hypothetical protein